VVDLVTDRGDIVLPASTAEEAREIVAIAIFGENALHVTTQVELRRKSFGYFQLPLETQALRDIAEELFDAPRTDLFEHLPLDFGHRIWNIGMNDFFSIAHRNLLTESRGC
jgi:hypothetical protein